MQQAQAADAAEDAKHSPDRRGDETPDWLADKQRRLSRIRAAMAQLEAEAKAGRGACDPDGPGPSSGMQERGNRRKPRATAPGDEAPAAPVPPDKAQRNFTDGDCRIVPSQGGFIAGYNGQIAVDAESQVIVAQRLSTNPADFGGLQPLVDDIMDDLGQPPGEVSGDTGFASEANLHAMDARGIEPYLCPGRMRHGSTDPEAGRILKRTPRMQKMAETIRSAGREGPYRLRKQVVEPVFGQIKQARGFRQFLLKGVQKVRGEWAMLRTAHNLCKLHKAAV